MHPAINEQPQQHHHSEPAKHPKTAPNKDKIRSQKITLPFFLSPAKNIEAPTHPNPQRQKTPSPKSRQKPNLDRLKKIAINHPQHPARSVDCKFAFTLRERVGEAPTAPVVKAKLAQGLTPKNPIGGRPPNPLSGKTKLGGNTEIDQCEGLQNPPPKKSAAAKND